MLFLFYSSWTSTNGFLFLSIPFIVDFLHVVVLRSGNILKLRKFRWNKNCHSSAAETVQKSIFAVFLSMLRPFTVFNDQRWSLTHWELQFRETMNLVTFIINSTIWWRKWSRIPMLTKNADPSTWTPPEFWLLSNIRSPFVLVYWSGNKMQLCKFRLKERVTEERERREFTRSPPLKSEGLCSRAIRSWFLVGFCIPIRGIRMWQANPLSKFQFQDRTVIVVVGDSKTALLGSRHDINLKYIYSFKQDSWVVDEREKDWSWNGSERI